MNLPKITKLVAVFLLILGVIPHFTFATLGPSLSIEAQDNNTNVGATLSINININTGDFAATASDVYLSYPAKYLKYKSGAKGNFFPEMSSVSYDENTGRIRLTGYTSTLGETRKGAASVATLSFEAIKEGKVEIAYICTGPNSETTVLDSEGNNILNCSSTFPGRITINAALPPQVTATPKPTAKPSAASPTPTTPVIIGINPEISPLPSSTPAPEENSNPTPEPTPAPTQKPSNYLKYAGLGFILLAGVILLVALIAGRKKKPPFPPTHNPPPVDTPPSFIAETPPAPDYQNPEPPAPPTPSETQTQVWPPRDNPPAPQTPPQV